MKLACYGSRGSLPTPSTPTSSTATYGGNTSCYYLEAGPFRFILDGGSGARRLGADLSQQGLGFPGTWVVLLSHFHWDHIQGLPFFAPLRFPGNTFYFHGLGSVREKLESQQQAPNFPVQHSEFPSERSYIDHPRRFSETFWYTYDQGGVAYARRQMLGDQAIKVTTIPLNHPNGCLGYRIEYMGKVLVYATDNEPLRHPNTRLTQLAQGADLLIMDGQYTEEQLADSTQGYGHGSPESCVEQAKLCGAKKLIIHHHDPSHGDGTLARMEEKAFSGSPEGWGEFAREGKVWTF